jgi:hypothetical protein
MLSSIHHLGTPSPLFSVHHLNVLNNCSPWELSGLKLLNSALPIQCLSPYTMKVLCIKQFDNFLMKCCARELQQRTLFRRLSVGFKLLMIKLPVCFLIHLTMKPQSKESLGSYLMNSCAMYVSPLCTLNTALHSYWRNYGSLSEVPAPL